MEHEKVWDNIAENWHANRNLLLEEVKEFLKNKKGKILDLGCGSGRNFIKGKEIYGVDFSKRMIELAEQYAKNHGINARLFKANAWELPFEDNFFDSAIFVAALHCVPSSKNREKSIKELKRVLKPESRALITVWNKNQERFKNEKKEINLLWGVGDGENRKEYTRYYYLYDKEEILEILNKYFKIVKIWDENSRFGKRNLIIEVEKE